MGFGRKVGAFLGLVPDDARHGEHYDEFESTEYSGEYGHDYGAEYGPEYAKEYPKPFADQYPPRSSSYERADYAPDRYPARAESGFAPEPAVQGALAMQPRTEPRREPESKAASRPVTIKLTGFAEARVIGEKYRDGQSVIMDMTEMADADARRLVDFAAGLAFAKRGSIDKVTTKVFMLLPSDVDVSAEDRREYAGAYSR